MAVQLIFITVTAACSQGASGDACEQLGQAFPALFYSIAGFFVAFYANQSLGIYREAFAACEDIKGSVVDLLKVIQATTIDPDSDQERRKALLLECWRTANLFHVVTYLLSDRTRQTYSWDGFLLPVSRAFGEYDGGEKLGMLRRWELEALTASIAEYDELPSPTPTRKSRRRASSLKSSSSELSKIHGSVQSKEAVLFDVLHMRLYKLVRQLLARKLTTVAWPVWHNLLTSLTSSSCKIQKCGIFRKPRVYREAVQIVCQAAVAGDAVVLAAKMGEGFRTVGADTWPAAIVAGFVQLALTTSLAILINACLMMEVPLGDSLIDMPGLSYVASAAEESLRLVVSKDQGSHTTELVDGVDLDALLGPAPAS